MKKFKEEQRRSTGVEKSKDSRTFFYFSLYLPSIVNWNKLMNFLPSTAFYGQRPSINWNRKHDADLLRGTHKYGYANYHIMKGIPEFNLNELDKRKIRYLAVL